MWRLENTNCFLLAIQAPIPALEKISKLTEPFAYILSVLNDYMFEDWEQTESMQLFLSLTLWLSEDRATLDKISSQYEEKENTKISLRQHSKTLPGHHKSFKVADLDLA